MEFSLAEIHEAIAATRPGAECLVFRDRRLTWAQVTERTRRLANHLIDSGPAAVVVHSHYRLAKQITADSSSAGGQQVTNSSAVPEDR